MIKLIIVKSSVSRPNFTNSTCFTAIETMVSELSCGGWLTDIKVIMHGGGAASSSHTRCTVIPEHSRIDFLVLSCGFLKEA